MQINAYMCHSIQFIWLSIFFFKNTNIFCLTKRANTNTNIFGLRKKGKYKYKYIQIDKKGQIQIQIIILWLVSYIIEIRLLYVRINFFKFVRYVFTT